jgi:hypothetical protein
MKIDLGEYGMNYELNELIENSDIVRFIKSRRIAWLGHVMRTDDKRISKRELEWKSIGTRIRGRPRKRWIVDIEENIQIMGKRRWRKQCKEAYDNCFFEKVFWSKPTKYTIGFTKYSPYRREWVKITHLPGKKITT